jgi:hypothetical protein
MIITDFNAGDSSTWPALLTVEEVAAIFRRGVHGLRKACQPRATHPFVPAPAHKYPLRWKKTDVVRALGGKVAA